MSCGMPHPCDMDILQDTAMSGGLELDRFKSKLREIWGRMLNETYVKYDEEMSKEEYMKANSLSFADEPEEETEIDNLMAMLEEMMETGEEHEDVTSGGKAPSYSGSQLKANNEKGKVESTKYEVKHTSTKTPGDSKSTVKSSTYDTPTDGKIAPRKDSRVIRSFSPMAEMMRDELVALKARQAIGRREMLYRM
jgi:hypothetical protein